ncbi:MAG: hypothetical protein ACTSUJ_02815 [Candidatus Njordarchaeales archaeon]
MSSISDIIEVFRAREKEHGFHAFIRRALASCFYQLKIYTSYRMNFALDLIDITISALIYYYIGFLVSPQDLMRLGYTPDYIAFALAGIALSRYIWTSVARLAHKMRHEISAGTFESLAAADFDDFHAWLWGQILYGFTWSSSVFFVTILLGYSLGASFTRSLVFWLQAILIVLLTVLIHAGIGVMAAGMYIVHKQLETLLVLLVAVIEFFGGVLYPLSLLWNYPPLYYIAMLIPFTHGLELFRRTIIDELPLTHPLMLRHLIILLVFFPTIFLGFKVFKHYLNKAKKTGLLAAY